MQVQRPTRDALHTGGYDVQHAAGGWTLVVPFKAGFVEHDELRVAVTTEALSVYVAGQDDAPVVAGVLCGRIEPSKCTWRVRRAKPRGMMAIDELVVTIAKADPSAIWRDLFKSFYV